MKRIPKLASIVLISFLLCFCSGDDDATTPNPGPGEPTEATKTLVEKLSVPWELIWGPDNFLWVTERNGKISRINPDSGEQQSIFTIPNVSQVGESGLLGMVLHPNFDTNPYVYVAYTYTGGSGLLERLVRYTYGNNTLSGETILLDQIPANSNHDGSRLLITPDMHILMTTGDAGNTNLSQDMNSLGGKTLRLKLDGTIPSDNPFTNSYIYSLGHRNAQGLVLHPNGKLYSSEHGPSSDDEINIIQAGKNYGWPSVQGKINTPNEQNFAATTEVIESIFEWTPTIAPSDLIYYTGNKIPEWTNKLLMTVLKDKRIVALTLNSDGTAITKEEVFFDGKFGRLRDIAVSPQGRVFIATNGDTYGDTSNTHRIIEINKIEK
ncbi:PQQ-dependent dehydrogenase (s-GDH family) [Aquimarina sp. MAR_2010_214]|uniref:PQQ-dependent sugar dehydrogenase n=1 Tax=Aquimarina sp. MAR_2010_214 TaxID=1250026 RepID=UPI000C7157CF|nr:PQQ-dependent sugar dehydrogenase [Aquimarina sp. MAR_2010_214]PKV51452.1 PQQ-dependent dehydrogenase (s-GDH family) [Aquimarina sp. MAR_2010_214]